MALCFLIHGWWYSSVSLLEWSVIDQVNPVLDCGRLADVLIVLGEDVLEL